MNKVRLLFLSLLIALFAFSVFGQVDKSVSSPNQSGESIYSAPKSVRDGEYEREKRNRKNGIDASGMIIQPPAERAEMPEILKEKIRKSIEERKNYELALKKLQPPTAYYEKYESFLKNGKTGLARIFVDKNCDEGKIVSVKELERCGDLIPVKGGGSYYSFRLRTNSFFARDWWDLHFIDNKFLAGNSSVQTIIAEIGDIDLKDIKLASKELAFLRDYKPKMTLEEIKAQSELLKKGVEANAFTYSNAVSANLDSTYVLRTIAYKVDNEADFYNSGKGVDMIIAFKVVGRENDGSLIMLWKELKTDMPRRKIN